ncbi:MAG TPA: 50S ribosomal protein L4 [Chthonomonadaceae bacterium]|nr:50S ribosomal protein L4 [Chthonomonadaceae bacterium]
MAAIPLFKADGKEAGSLALPDEIFGVEFNEALVHQAVVAEEANQRQGTADTKGRSEIRGGGKKPWRQKGTGRARQGTIRAPHFRHGGVVGGPTPRDYRKAFPVKMRRAAIRCALSRKVADGDMIGLEALGLEPAKNERGEPLIKTRQAVALLTALGLAETRRVLVIIPEHDPLVLRAMRNLPGVELRFAPNFSVRDVLTAHKIVLAQEAVARIAAVWTPGRAQQAAQEEVAA